jgi:N-formylglutamate amidohydrolase
MDLAVVTADSPPLFRLQEGGSCLLISVPHAGTFVPAPILAQLTETGRTLPDTDWHVDRLYDFAPACGATLLVATHARFVVDLNRDPAGGRLYPGQAETTICPTETFDGEPVYDGRPPDAAELALRIATYWQPYHAALARQLERLRGLHGRAVLLDAHSIRGEVPRLFQGSLPDLNFGTNGGAAATPDLAAAAMRATAGAGFSQVLDGRFRGGYITRHYGRPGDGVQAIQLELATRTYLDETAPRRFNPDRAGKLIEVLKHLVRCLSDA